VDRSRRPPSPWRTTRATWRRACGRCGSGTPTTPHAGSPCRVPRCATTAPSCGSPAAASVTAPTSVTCRRCRVSREPSTLVAVEMADPDAELWVDAEAACSHYGIRRVHPAPLGSGETACAATTGAYLVSDIAGRGARRGGCCHVTQCPLRRVWRHICAHKPRHLAGAFVIRERGCRRSRRLTRRCCTSVSSRPADASTDGTHEVDEVLDLRAVPIDTLSEEPAWPSPATTSSPIHR